MSRTLYCRHDRCGQTVEVVAGLFPAVCPGCQQDSKWSTTPGNIDKPRAKPPRVPFDLTLNDRRFLTSLRIQADHPDADDDGA